MIDIENLRKSFGDVEVLKGINLTIKEKEVVVIIGPSGSGKSTLLRCMNYLEEPTSGEVSVDGIVLDGEANINKVREEVGMVFQRFNGYRHSYIDAALSPFFAAVNNFRRTDLLFQFLNTSFYERLLVFCIIIFRVFRKVAHSDGFFQTLCYLAARLCTKFIQFFL